MLLRDAGGLNVFLQRESEGRFNQYTWVCCEVCFVGWVPRKCEGCRRYQLLPVTELNGIWHELLASVVLLRITENNKYLELSSVQGSPASTWSFRIICPNTRIRNHLEEHLTYRVSDALKQLWHVQCVKLRKVLLIMRWWCSWDALIKWKFHSDSTLSLTK
jgi:hypothetical protein